MKINITAIRIMLSIVLLLFLSLAQAFAQETPAVPLEKPSPKPVKGELGIGLRASGLKGMFWEGSFDSISLQVRRVQSSNLIFRTDIGVNFTSSNNSSEDVSPAGTRNFRENTERSILIVLAPGVERHFKGARRIDPYVGVAVPLVFQGKTHETNIDDFIFDDGDYFKSKTETTLPGGLGFGLNGLVGVNYYLFNRLSVGLEYNFGFTLLHSKGKVESKTTDREKIGANPEIVAITDNDGPERKFNSIHLGNQGVFGFNLIFYFGPKG